MASLCMQDDELSDPKGPWDHCCSFTLAETAKVVQAQAALRIPDKSHGKCTENI